MWDLPICSYIIKQKTAYEMRISDWSSDVCSSDLKAPRNQRPDRKAEIARIADPRHRSRGRSDRTAQADAGIKVRGRHIHPRRGGGQLALGAADVGAAREQQIGRAHV